MSFPFALSHLALPLQLICGRLIAWSKKEGSSLIFVSFAQIISVVHLDTNRK